ncbi:MAG TPA: rRNA pseudouridine synthase, partial [Spirochaetaceae bacterium]|nr:rRNA pseudouridine synthase [Spirochaetaceae bacterium]
MNTTPREKIRLQAYLASCGIGSRRACEKLLQGGRVSVNGTIAKLGDSAFAGDEVRLDGKVVRQQTRLRYIALNKPVGFVTSMSDEMGRPVAASLVGSFVEERVYNVGRLDQWSSGLIFFTNDGDLTALLVHPSGRVDKEYEVETDLPIPEAFAKEFEDGVTIDGILYRAESVRVVGERRMNIVLVEGKNREIRRVLEHYGLRALALKRVRIGP